MDFSYKTGFEPWLDKVYTVKVRFKSNNVFIQHLMLFQPKKPGLNRVKKLVRPAVLQSSFFVVCNV